ncbi:hypothetical protein FOA52_011217 [Chlamydomonas sp. UWO 241]|nr:hypothetical protein FOA52_011217 [Chlamydomonas sp. UWO 241]
MRGTTVLSLSLLLAAVLLASPQVRGVPHVDECNCCEKCELDGEPPQLLKPDGREATVNPPIERFGPLLQPPDPLAKAALPNCTECRGCNVLLSDIGGQAVKFADTGVSFQHGLGATNTRLFFASMPGSEQRFIIKVWCIPVSKLRSVTGPVTCSVKQASERVEILLAQQALAEDCGITEITPRVWLAKLSGLMPGLGYHVHWHGLVMEEARGITLHALNWGRHWRLTLELMQEKLNRTRVQIGAVWDLLTAQCDRHAENVFVDEDGNIQLIDNDKALGVIAKCGYDSMLLPGTRYHSTMRIGFWGQHVDKYRGYRKKPEFCRGPIDPRVVVDYRCTLAPGLGGTNASKGLTLGTSYPPGLTSCMKRVSGMSVEEVMEEFGLSSPLRAGILRNRSIDMLSHGFEWTMEHGLPLNGGRVATYPQPPCCSLQVVKRMVVCDECWSPLLPEDLPKDAKLKITAQP